MAWATPATRDGWSFSGDFYVESSNHNNHRRATVPELQALYGGGGDGAKDPPAHWYEAQLLHYGLPPSKTKGTAKMRLFEAVNKGGLTVPAHIKKIEADLKRDWTKRERDAKQALKASSAVVPHAAKGTKRKASSDGVPTGGTHVSINLTVSVSADGSLQVSQPGPGAKKTKKVAASPASVKKTQTKATAPKTSAAPKKPGPSKSNQAVSASPGKPTAVKSEPTVWPPPASSAPRTKQTSCRGGGSAAHCQPRGSVPSSSAGYDEPPPAYREYDDNSRDWKSSYGKQHPYRTGLPPLGLLNGRYNIYFPDGYFANLDSMLVMTLDGNALWGCFGFGNALSGVLRIEHRPYQASWDAVEFRWRGTDDEGDFYIRDGDGSFFTFMGDGQINGAINFCGSLQEFDGERVSGQKTKSEVSRAEMKAKWDKWGI